MLPLTRVSYDVSVLQHHVNAIVRLDIKLVRVKRDTMVEFRTLQDVS